MRPIILSHQWATPAGTGPQVAGESPDGAFFICDVQAGDRGHGSRAFRGCRAIRAKARLKRLSAPGEAQGECGCIEFLQPASCPENARFAPGKVDAGAAEAAFACIVEAIRLSQEGQAAAVATAPINKEALHLSGHNFSGHTEIFTAHYTGAKEYAMLLVHGPLGSDDPLHHPRFPAAGLRFDCSARERVLATIRLANLGGAGPVAPAHRPASRSPG